MNRRDFLAVGSTFGAVGVSGCVGTDMFSSGKSEEMGPIILQNQTPDPQQIEIKLQREGSEVFYETYNLSAQGENTSERQIYKWGQDNQAARWTVSAKLDSTTWESESFGADAPPYCHIVEVRIGEWKHDPLLIVVNDCAAMTVDY